MKRSTLGAHSGGVVVLAFNSYLPRRLELVDAFTEVDLQAQED